MTKKIKLENSKQEKGYILSMVVFFILMIALSLAMSMAFLVASQQLKTTRATLAIQAYYGAESGIEEAMLRLRNNYNMSNLSYSFAVGNATANVVIGNIVNASRTINSSASLRGVNRMAGVQYSVDATKLEFHYGAEVGVQGLEMEKNSIINGNVFSNGVVTGEGAIANNLIVANANTVSGSIAISGSVLAHNCVSPVSVGGNLIYVTGGVHTCSVTGSTTARSSHIFSQSLPISDTQVTNWRNSATLGGTISGNYSLGNDQTASLGPRRITGNLVLGNNATLNVTGTLYVQGNITIGNNSTIRLDSSYSTFSGIIILDGNMSTSNNTTFTGSGQAGSYLVILSTSNSSSAIVINDDIAGAIFYAKNGKIIVDNNVVVEALVGDGIHLGNAARINYNSAFQNLFFIDELGGKWKITDWTEK